MFKRHKVKIYVDGKLSTTVKVRSDKELGNLLPDIIRRTTHKGRGRVVRTTQNFGRITHVWLENTTGLLVFPKKSEVAEPVCFVAAPRNVKGKSAANL